MAQSIRIGVQAGAGPAPGYLWTVYYLKAARDEAEKFLNDAQYAHAADLIRTLDAEAAPTHPATLSVDAVEDIFEVRDKGGILGKINLRIFFIVRADAKAIVVGGAIKKEADGQTPSWAKIRMRARLRRLNEHGFGGQT